MTIGFSLLAVLTLLGAAQGVFLALALINTKSGDTKAHRILGLFTFLLAIDIGEEFLYQTGVFTLVPHLIQILAPIDLLYGPVLYFYVAHLTARKTHGRRGEKYLHFAPAAVGAFLLTPFYFHLDGEQKLRYVELIRTGEMDATVAYTSVRVGMALFALLTLAQIGLYLLLCIREVRTHYDNITQEFSNLDAINLTWLRNLLIGLSLIYLLFLFDQFFPNLFGMNFLGDSITVLAVILIYAMGYLGMRQPRIFTQTYTSADKTPDGKSSAPESVVVTRYKKSGLDKETGQSFLEDLMIHMEKNQPYLQAGLTLPELAEQLGITSNYLSQIINEQKGLNFHDFINQHRVEEAKRLIRSMDKPNILQIAFDSGFNSKSAFYTAFKKGTSMTPTQFSRQKGT